MITRINDRHRNLWLLLRRRRRRRRREKVLSGTCWFLCRGNRRVFCDLDPGLLCLVETRTGEWIRSALGRCGEYVGQWLGKKVNM